ncbi:hypothetical protein XarbCFBP8152_10740 [Xanthomonas arboricola]|nr:hypothetical protein XarbCFBP8152_10740 [Xanthomonas arboricola]
MSRGRIGIPEGSGGTILAGQGERVMGVLPVSLRCEGAGVARGRGTVYAFGVFAEPGVQHAQALGLARWFND